MNEFYTRPIFIATGFCIIRIAHYNLAKANFLIPFIRPINGTAMNMNAFRKKANIHCHCRQHIKATDFIHCRWL
jgi:hypothetical protein